LRRIRQPPENAPTRCANLVLRKAEPVEQGGRPRARRVAFDMGVRVVREGEPLAVAGRFGRRELGLDPPQLGVAVHDELDGRAVEPERLLRDVGDHPAGRDLHVARVRVELVPDEREQAGLAAPVRTDETDALARVDGGVDVLEQQLGAAPERDFAEGDHGAGMVAEGAADRLL
jgi:hypothetical protein